MDQGWASDGFRAILIPDFPDLFVPGLREIGGKFLVTGNANVAGKIIPIVAQFNSNGCLDSDFGDANEYC